MLPRSRSVAARELRDHRLAHRELLHLAGDGRGKSIDHPNVARNLVVRDTPLAEGLDLLRAQGRSALGNNPGADLLAVLRVGHADDLNVLDLRVRIAKLLDLA